MEALQRKFNAYLDEHGWPNSNEKISFMLYSNGWAVFSQDLGQPAWSYERIGNHIFFSLNYHYPYEIGIYTEKNGQVFTLKDAHNAGVINVDEIAQWCSQPHPGTPYPKVYQPGDLDRNGKVEISDVLTVQKRLAKIWVTEDPFMLLLYDFDGNGEINMKDALDMQKKIAKVTV